MWNLKRKTKQRQTHRYREETEGCQKGVGPGAGEKGEGIKNYKLVVTKTAPGIETAA